MPIPHHLSLPDGAAARVPEIPLPSCPASALLLDWKGESLVIDGHAAGQLRGWAEASGVLLRPIGAQEWGELVMELRLGAPWGKWTGVNWSMSSGGIQLMDLRSWVEGPPEEVQERLLDAATDHGMDGYPSIWIEQFRGQKRELLCRCLETVRAVPLQEALRAAMHAYRRCYGILCAVENAAGQAEVLASRMMQALNEHHIEGALALGEEIEMLEALSRDLDSWPGPWTPWVERVRLVLGRAWARPKAVAQAMGA
jgi:hypothetical protein